MGERIVITSGKGGVGKTTATTNLGIALAAEGATVVLVDADVGLNNLDVAMGVEHKVIYDLLDVAEGKCRLRQALIRDERIDTLSVLPSAKGYGEKPGVKEMQAIVAELAKEFDFVLIDCPAGIEQGFHRAVSAAERAVVVTTPHIGAVRDADKVLGLLSVYPVTIAGLLVNRIRPDLIERGATMSPEDIARLLKTELLATVPEDDGVGIGHRAFVRSGAGEAYRLAALRLMGKGSEIYDYRKKNLLRRIFGR